MFPKRGWRLQPLQAFLHGCSSHLSLLRAFLVIRHGQSYWLMLFHWLLVGQGQDLGIFKIDPFLYHFAFFNWLAKPKRYQCTTVCAIIMLLGSLCRNNCPCLSLPFDLAISGGFAAVQGYNARCLVWHWDHGNAILLEGLGSVHGLEVHQQEIITVHVIAWQSVLQKTKPNCATSDKRHQQTKTFKNKILNPMQSNCYSTPAASCRVWPSQIPPSTGQWQTGCPWHLFESAARALP